MALIGFIIFKVHENDSLLNVMLNCKVFSDGKARDFNYKMSVTVLTIWDHIFYVFEIASGTNFKSTLCHQHPLVTNITAAIDFKYFQKIGRSLNGSKVQWSVIDELV